MIEILTGSPAYLVVGLLAAAALSGWVVSTLLRRVRHENRYDCARDGAGLRIDALARTISYADVTISSGDCTDERTDALRSARSTFARLASRRELFLEQGATINEWNGLAAEAGKCQGDLQSTWDHAKGEVFSAKLARQATAAAEIKLATFATPDNSVDTAAVAAKLASAQQLFAAKRYGECRDACKAIDPLIKLSEDEAAVAKLLAEADACCHGGGQRKTIEAAREHLQCARAAIQSGEDLDAAQAALSSARSKLHKLTGK